MHKSAPWFAVVVVLAMLAASVTASAQTTITWLVSGTSDEREVAEAEIIRRFEAMYPHIKVNREVVVRWEDYYPTLITRVLGNAAPDVAFNQSPSTIAEGIFLDLEPFIQRDNFDLSVFNPVLLEYGRTPKRPGLYTLPNHMATPAMYYNKELFGRFGLPTPNEMFDMGSWSWDDFIDVSRKLMEYDPATGDYKRRMINWIDQLNVVYQNGGRFFNEDLTESRINTPETIRGLERWQSLFVEHNVFGDGYIDGFIAERLVMVNEWTSFWRFENVPFEWDVAPYPWDTKKAAIVGFGGYGIPHNTQHPEEAWLFLKWILGPEAQEIYSLASGDISARQDVAAALYSDPSWGPAGKWQAFVVPMVEYGVASESYLSPIWGQVEGLLWNLGAPLRDGSGPAAAVAENIHNVVQGLLNQQ